MNGAFILNFPCSWVLEVSKSPISEESGAPSSSLAPLRIFSPSNYMWNYALQIKSYVVYPVRTLHYVNQGQSDFRLCHILSWPTSFPSQTKRRATFLRKRCQFFFGKPELKAGSLRTRKLCQAERWGSSPILGQYIQIMGRTPFHLGWILTPHSIHTRVRLKIKYANLSKGK